MTFARWAPCALFMLALIALAPAARAGERVTVGSKAFPENWILGEAAATLARSAGADAEHLRNLGTTEIVYAALTSGQIDLYAEYTGTLREVVLRGARADTEDAVRAELARRGLGVTARLGFDDRYALAASTRSANAHGLRTISDLLHAPGVRVGLTHEFLGRADGYPGLVERYGLALTDVRGVQHELALEAIAKGDLDVIDAYTTDAQLARIDVVLLEDDRRFFPRYDAVLLYRLDAAARAPRAFEAILKLTGAIDEARMVRANAAVVIDRRSVEEAASTLLRDSLGPSAPSAEALRPGALAQIAKNTLRHTELVLAALLAAILAGVPLGVIATRSRALAAVTVTAASLLQTVPSLALLALLIPLVGIGARPALVALFLYGLLPIVRGTHAGLTTIPKQLAEAAAAIGLSARARLTRVLLPMASPHILAGVKTSAVINVGTATVAALVGADGLGNPIMQGIALRDTSLILQGAIPAALLALAAEGGFALLGRVVVPRGLRA